MLTRRTVLGLAAAGTAAGVPLLASAFFAKADAGDGLPVTVANDTGRFPNSAITMYVVGTDPAGRQGYVRQSGVFTPVSFDANGPDGAADIGVRLAESGTTSFVLPKMSGRIYFAIEGRLRFTVVADGAGRPALQYPVGWSEGDPSFGVLHDCCEFTYNDAGMFCNTTMVDMFSIPMSLRLEGTAGRSVAGAPLSGGRDAIFAEMARQDGFRNLVVGDKLRIVAPGHAIAMGRFDGRYFDGYVDDMWAHYAANDLTVRTVAGTFTGRVVDGKLQFGGGVRAFDKPTTRDVLFCDGTLAAPNDGVSGPVAAVLAAALNRSVLGQPEQPVLESARYYQQPVTNHYARILHAHSGDGKAYGFAFDDVAQHAAYIEDRSPARLHVTLAPFGDGPAGGPSADAVPPPPPPPPPAGGGGGRSAYERIPADAYADESGIRTEDCAEGGRNIGWIANGDRVRYAGVDFGAEPATRFAVRVASGAAPGVSGLIEIRLDDAAGPEIGSIAVASTGGWQSWHTVPGTMAPVTGVHDVHVTFTSGQPQEFVNVCWLEFGR